MLQIDDGCRDANPPAVFLADNLTGAATVKRWEMLGQEVVELAGGGEGEPLVATVRLYGRPGPPSTEDRPAWLSEPRQNNFGP